MEVGFGCVRGEWRWMREMNGGDRGGIEVFTDRRRKSKKLMVMSCVLKSEEDYLLEEGWYYLW